MSTKFCVQCGNLLDSNTVFCPVCGTKQTQPTYTPPPPPLVGNQTTYSPYSSYNQSQYYDPYAPKPISTKSKVLGGIGLGLSIFGLVVSIIMFIYSMAALELDSSSYYYDSSATVMATIVIVYSIIFMAASIIGLVFSNIARNDGNLSGLTKTGKVLGTIGIIVFCIAIVFSMGSL